MIEDHSKFPLPSTGKVPAFEGSDKPTSLPTPGGTMNPAPPAISGETQPAVPLPSATPFS